MQTVNTSTAAGIDRNCHIASYEYMVFIHAVEQKHDTPHSETRSSWSSQVSLAYQGRSSQVHNYEASPASVSDYRRILFHVCVGPGCLIGYEWTPLTDEGQYGYALLTICSDNKIGVIVILHADWTMQRCCFGADAAVIVQCWRQETPSNRCTGRVSTAQEFLVH